MKKHLYPIILTVAVMCCLAGPAMAHPILKPEGMVWEVELLNEFGEGEHPYLRNHYTYDEQGRVLVNQKEEYGIDDAGHRYWCPTAQFIYTYGEYGITERKVMSYNSSKGEYYQSGRWEYIYTDGMVTRFNSYKRDELDTYHKYRNENGHCVEDVSYNNRNQVTSRLRYTYDEEGRLATMTGTTGSYTTYHYDAADRQDTIRLYASEGGDLVHLQVYVYDDAARTTTLYDNRVVTDSIGIQDYYVMTSTYDAHGNLVREQMHFYVAVSDGYRNDDWDYRYSYQYDAEGRLVRFEYDESSDTHIVYSYSYDENHPAGLEQTTAGSGAVKTVRDGQLLIRKDGVEYSIIGQKL